ncbi:HtaA domain-containing protein [Arthrobacter sp. NPDC056493]|uniref:HtaA domain-containing protein n=1 Tax=Arthrobacter sp. NPDC056493 TaxID=3345839 RepID=UPI00366B3398
MSEAPEVGLVWGVKASFLNYLAHTGDATTSVIGAAAPTTTGKFYFGPDAAQVVVDPKVDTMTLKFCGEVQFLAHHGVLRVEICDPWVTFSERGSYLSIAIPNTESSRIPLASLEFAAPSVMEGVAMWSALPTRLTAEGTAIFDGIYPAGESFDPVTIRAVTGWLDRH